MTINFKIDMNRYFNESDQWWIINQACNGFHIKGKERKLVNLLKKYDLQQYTLEFAHIFVMWSAIIQGIEVAKKMHESGLKHNKQLENLNSLFDQIESARFYTKNGSSMLISDQSLIRDLKEAIKKQVKLPRKTKKTDYNGRLKELVQIEYLLEDLTIKTRARRQFLTEFVNLAGHQITKGELKIIIHHGKRLTPPS